MLNKKVNLFFSFGVIAVLLLGLCSCKVSEKELKIFANIQECENIADLKTENANIEIYETPEKDKSLKDLEYEEFFGCEYTSEEFKFKIFAYEFLSDDNARKYFENETGKANDPNPTFLDSGGMRSFSRIVISKNRAYMVSCTKADSEQVVAFINSCFSKRIIVTRDGDYPALIEAGKTGDGSIVSKER